MDKQSELCCCILMYQETNNQSTPRLFLMLDLQTSDELSHTYYHRSFKTGQRRNQVEEKSEQSTDESKDTKTVQRNTGMQLLGRFL